VIAWQKRANTAAPINGQDVRPLQECRHVRSGSRALYTHRTHASETPGGQTPRAGWAAGSGHAAPEPAR
jgi:hypothetical protein